MTVTTGRGGLVSWLKGTRAAVRRTRGGRLAWRIGVTVVGVAIVAAGVVLLPLPGPGWLIIFAGLGVLATEYKWAARLLRFARAKVAAWSRWVASRSRPVQALLAVVGLVVIIAAGVLAWWYYTQR